MKRPLLLSAKDRIWAASGLVIFAALAVLPLIVGIDDLSSYRDIMLFALFAVALDLFWGSSGILSFGHAAFFGLGAYSMAIVTVTFGVTGGLGSLGGLVAGIGLAGSLAAALAYFLFRGGVRGEYFTVITLVVSLIAQNIAVGWSDVTGGDSGLIGVPPLTLGSWSLADPLAQFYAMLGLLAVVTVGIWLRLRGRTGRVLRAIEDNEVKVETLGYATSNWLVTSFAVSAAISGLAGALYAAMNGFVAPDLSGLMMSTEVVVWVAIGGRGTLLGPIVGAFVLWQLQQRISSVSNTLWPLFMGLFFIFMVFALPEGLPSLGRRIAGLRRRRSPGYRAPQEGKLR